MTEADFLACLKDKALYDRVKAMHDFAAAKLGVQSTPTFFVNGVDSTGEHGARRISTKILASPPK